MQKRWMALAMVAVLALGGCALRSPEAYYRETPVEDGIEVTLAIRCDVLLEREIPSAMKKVVPKNGALLETESFVLEEGASGYDLLIKAAKTHRLALDISGTGKTAYLRGIGGIGEFDFGERSGWIYRVNGKQPGVGCGGYVLENGDAVEFLYTCTLGEDLGS